MKYNLKGLFTLLFAMCIGLSSYAQSSTPYESITVLKNNTFEKSFVGYQEQVINKKHGKVVFSGTKPNKSFVYTADSAYTGRDTLIIQYQDTEDWFRHQLFYLSYVIDVVNSVVIAEQDYYSIYMDEVNVSFAVTLNDSSSQGDAKITAIPLVNHGTATISNDSTISFTPTAGYAGMAYINYALCDGIGECDQGAITICVVDSTVGISTDTVRAITKQEEAIVRPLPNNNFVISDSAEHGQLSFLNSDLIEYTPDLSFNGNDTFLLTDDTLNVDRLFIVQVLKRNDNRVSLLDDVVYTTINKKVLIDVQANDVTDNFETRIERHPDQGTLLYIDSLELYEYTPPLNIESIESFDYSLKGGRINEEAEASIYINDGHPDTSSHYIFTTPENTPIVLDYEVPIDGHEFTVKLSPAIGTLNIYNQDTTVEVGCDSITGNHFIVFEPGRNYIGPHIFQLEHCVTGTAFCRIIDITVNSVIDPYTGCYCMENCVWSGDINSDGRVDMRDLLPLAHHIGETGNIRNGASVKWNAQTCNDWNETIVNTQVDLKHVDANGDGMITVADTQGISDFYYNEHSMVPELVGPSRNHAFYLKPRFDTVRAGELAVIDVEFGNAGSPIVDMEGVAYTLLFAPHVEYDSATLEVIETPGSWLTFNSPYIHMDKQPRKRKVDIGLARTTGTTATGTGIIHTVSFIVEDDLVGIKSKNGIIPLEITLKGATGIDGAGQTYSMPDAHMVFYLKIAEENEPAKLDPNKLILWPNPSRGTFKMHLNGQNTMQSAILISAEGKVLQQWKDLPGTQAEFTLPDLANGLYIMRVETSLGPITKKVQIMKQ